MKTYTIDVWGSLDLTEETTIQCNVLKVDNKSEYVVYADHVRIEFNGRINSIHEEGS